MTTRFRQNADKGFTLIELLIVVIIIAILAAIAIPQFANTSSDAQESALDANLSTVRSAVELYRIQHNNAYPGTKVSDGATTCAGDKGTGSTANGAQAFKDQLLAYSNQAGQTCSVSGTDFIYGPYLRAMPKEPINSDDTINMVTVAKPADPAATDKGWRFNTVTGRFDMNSGSKDRSGKLFSTH